MRRVLRAASVLAVLGLAAGGLGLWAVSSRLAPVEPGSDRLVDFTVERGQGLRQVATALERRGLVRDANVLVLLGRLRDGVVKAGEYQVSPGWKAGHVLAHLEAGRVRTYTMVLPEGQRASEIADRLAAAGLTDREAFLRAVGDPELAHALGVPAPSLEGYLFPETYELPKSLPPEELVRILVGQFDRAWAQIEAEAQEQGLDRETWAGGLGLSKQEIVTLASIVEKETAAPEERPLIATVFLNRLRRGMRLETDPTVIYGIADFDGNLRKRHLLDDRNPYNTYRIAGLPPGPIANPGAEALRAVVRPADSDYLYFVSRNDGTHQFSKTYRHHVDAVNLYQKQGRRSRKP